MDGNPKKNLDPTYQYADILRTDASAGMSVFLPNISAR